MKGTARFCLTSSLAIAVQKEHIPSYFKFITSLSNKYYIFIKKALERNMVVFKACIKYMYLL